MAAFLEKLRLNQQPCEMFILRLVLVEKKFNYLTLIILKEYIELWYPIKKNLIFLNGKDSLPHRGFIY